MRVGGTRCKADALALISFGGGLCGGVAHSGAGTASRPGVKLLSLVQLVINKSNGQFDFIPCVCLCGTWHTQTLFLPSKMVSVFIFLMCTLFLEHVKF